MYRDYAAKGVTFYYLYKALAHPGRDGYVTPFTIDERLRHVTEAKEQLGTAIPWLVDRMDNRAKHALGDAPNAEFVFDPEGRLIVRRRWSDPEALRQDLARLVGAVESPTKVSDLDLPERTPAATAPTGVVERVDVPAGMIPLETEPIPGKKKIPFYAKLRAEAERSLLRDGKGTLYFGFFLDPLYNIHWNNEIAPVRFELEVPEGATAHPMKGEGPTLEVKADADPREFLIEVTDAGDTNATLRVNVHYFACDDAETYCVPVTQHYDVHLQRDRDGGRRMTGRGGPGGEGTRNPRERLLEYDASGDGEISREELPERMRRVFDRLDANRDGSLDEDELRRGMRGRRRDPARMVERLMQMDDDGDGRLSREEAPERMGLMFERMDANGDGLIDRKEIEAVRELFRRRPPPR